jgi:phospholipid N-methyltransferase
LVSSGNGKHNGLRNGIRTEFGHRWRFLRRYLRSPNVVGAIAPSSRALAAAVCEPYRSSARPVHVLEVGAGTGAVTRHIGTLLSEGDQLDICEIQPDFADILERDVLTSPVFASAVAASRVRVLRVPAQELRDTHRYDFVICGLPLTAFELTDVRAVFEVMRRVLKPGGVFSYYEYLGLRTTSQALSIGRRRVRIRAVSKFLSQHIHDHQFAAQAVLPNLPPAYARHLRFDRNGSGNGTKERG